MAITIKKISCPAGSVENSDATYSTTVASGGSLTLPKSEVNVNTVNEGSVVSVKDIDIDVIDSSGTVTPDSVTIVGNTVRIDVPDCSPTPVGATLMKTGQTTSYHTGDDGDLEVGRETDFLTLASANPFGTTERFTDELGTQTYTNKIIIDWSTYNGTTVLGYTDLSSVDTWSNVLSYCTSLTVGSYTSGWRLANIRELYNISNFDRWPHSYTPFNIFNSGNWMSMMWASTSYPYDPVAQAAAYNWNYFNLFWRSKTLSYYGMPVRTFTVNGTTLT